jgi:hypothetical protein
MSFVSGQDLLTGGRKACAHCQRILPLASFTPKPALTSGYDSWCRSCRAEYLREWRVKRKAAV